MGTWIKRITALVGMVVVLLVAAVVALPFVIDPNALKGQVQTLAAEQGVDLRLGGPISWQFFPVLGLSVSKVRLAPVQTPDDALADVQELTAAVAVMPLFKRQIRIKELRVADAKIQLQVDANGKGNWEAFSKPSEPTPPTQPADGDGSALNTLDINIASIQLSNANLVYLDQQSGQRTTVSDFDLNLTDVNTEQRPFPMTLALVVDNPALAKPQQLSLTSQLAINQALNEFVISAGRLQMPEANIELNLATTATIAEELRFQGKLSADLKNLSALFAVLGLEKPVTGDPNVLSRASLATDFSGTPTAITFSALSLQLDDTTFNGDVALTLPSEPNNLSITANLRGDKLNVDRYLAPSADDTTTSTPTPTTDSPLPLEALRTTDAALGLRFDEIIVNQLPITQLDLAVNGKQGLWQLQKFNANFYQGTLNTTGKMDARGNRANTEFTAELNGLALLPLLTDLADIDKLRGSVAASIKASTQAATTQQLFDNLTAIVSFNGDSVVVSGINVEQKYCEMVTQVGAESKSTADSNDTTAESTATAAEPTAPITWPQETTINELLGSVTLDKGVITVQKINAQVAYLLLGTKGSLDIKQQNYELSLPLTLTKNKTSENGCLVASDFLLNREINVLGCSGNLAELAPAKQCGLRKDAVSDLAKQAVRYNAEKSIAKKVTPKVDAKKEELEEKKEETKEKVRDRLKDLLNRQ